MDIKKERELFESWARNNTNWSLYWSDNIEQYMDHQTNAAWFSWLAAKQQAVPEGHCVVPIEPTKDQIEAGVYAVDLVSNDNVQVVNVYKAMIGACDE